MLHAIGHSPPLLCSLASAESTNYGAVECRRKRMWPFPERTYHSGAPSPPRHRHCPVCQLCVYQSRRSREVTVLKVFSSASAYVNQTLAWGMLPSEKFRVVSMRLECLPGLKQGLQAGKNTWPSIRAGSVSGVILGPLVMRHRYFRGFGLGHQFDSCARRLIILAHCEGVLQDFWRLKPQDLPLDVGHGLAIGSRAHPCEQATRLKVRLKLSAREDDAVRLPRHKTFPNLLRGGGNVEDIFQWCLMGHDCSDSPAPSYIQRQKPSKAVVPSVLPYCSHY